MSGSSPRLELRWTTTTTSGADSNSRATARGLRVPANAAEHWGRDVPVRPWGFTTDCGLFTERGVPIVGFSPCEAEYAHTPIDRVSIDLMIEAWEAYPVLIDAISTLPAGT